MLYKKLWLNLWVFAVTTFAVVWIEIVGHPHHGNIFSVTTFAVVWIEILHPLHISHGSSCHHLRGGVD